MLYFLASFKAVVESLQLVLVLVGALSWPTQNASLGQVLANAIACCPLCVPLPSRMCAQYTILVCALKGVLQTLQCLCTIMPLT
jgi:hypothetical protein